MDAGIIIAIIAVFIVVVLTRRLDRRTDDEHEKRMEEWRIEMRRVHGGNTYEMLKQQDRDR